MPRINSHGSVLYDLHPGEYEQRLAVEMRHSRVNGCCDSQAKSAEEERQRLTNALRERPEDWGAARPTGTIKPRPCMVCGKSFKGNSPLMQVCSPECFRKRDQVRKAQYRSQRSE